ncbi:MAG: 16S rRNA (guanine(966)-N(2))-methyltransferase RsmD [Tetrasphaera sp.]|nr:16S rRNA (guanine(966)-N(2))-methyltransferase RsmD [Tetrasphaera sp.]
MTRIIGGSAGGRRVAVPKGAATRPTSDRVREALFNILAARGLPRGVAVLDAYAGSGALGLEAASRGATRVVCVESHRATARLIEANATSLGLTVQVCSMPVAEYAARPPDPVGLVLADPPYPMSEDDLARDVAALVDGGHVEPGGLLVIERSTRSPQPRWPAGVVAEPVRRYGETALWLGTC